MALARVFSVLAVALLLGSALEQTHASAPSPSPGSHPPTPGMGPSPPSKPPSHTAGPSPPPSVAMPPSHYAPVPAPSGAVINRVGVAATAAGFLAAAFMA